MTAVASGAPVRARVGDFYTWMSAAFVATAFLGFIPTYFEPMAQGKFQANPVVHLHGVAFFGWTLFALVQTSLVPAGKTALHRSVGLIGVSFATLLTVLGLLAALNSLNTATIMGFGQAGEAFLIVPLLVIVSFAVLFTAAVANVRRPEVHKRLMLLATVSVLNAPVARPMLTWVLHADMPGGQPPVWINAPVSWLSYGFIVIAMAHDWKTRGRPHTVYVVALPVLAFLAWAVIPVSETMAWHSFARDFLALAGKPPAAPV